jgi:hypothetical protein
LSHDNRGSPVHRKQRRRVDRGSVGRRRGALARTATAFGILAIWAGSTIYDITSLKYNPPEGINTLALAAATYLFGSAFLKENS